MNGWDGEILALVGLIVVVYFIGLMVSAAVGGRVFGPAYIELTILLAVLWPVMVPVYLLLALVGRVAEWGDDNL